MGIDKWTYLFYFMLVLIVIYFINYITMKRKDEEKIFDKALFNEIADAILILNESLEIIQCNHKAVHLFNKTDGLIGRKIHEFMPRDILTKVNENTLNEYLKKGNKEMVITNKKLNDIWIDMNIKKFYVLDKSYIMIDIVDVSAHKKYEEKIEYLAYHDTLTNLPNRRFGNEKLQLSIQKALKNKNMLGVMFIDLDEFKLANDTLGHAAGDEVLRSVAVRLRKAVRKDDSVVRLGGDEFMIILDDIIFEDEIIHIADRILKIFSQPFVLKGKAICITCSIGIAVLPHHGTDKKTLLDHADKAMYEAKESGKNNFKIFNHTINKESLIHRSN